MKIIERLHLYFEYRGIKPTAFEKAIGLSNGYLGTQLRRNADMGETVLLKIIDNCLDLSRIWLIFGEGDMIISDQKQERPVNDEPVKSDSGQITLLKEQIREKDTIIQDLNRKIGQLEAKTDFLRESVPTFGYSIASEPKLAHKKGK